MTKVKICGIRRVEDAIVAAEAGADFLGFVFYERSRRAVRPQAAREVIAAARERGHARMVGVFVNADASQINEMAREAGLDYAQLSGDEPESLIDQLDVPAIQVVHMRAETGKADLANWIAESSAKLVLLDTPSEGFGGAGRSFDWDLVPALERPVLLAGGLNPGNVADAIGRVGPWGVDVSSGVETDGHKDQALIREFLTVASEMAADNITESHI